MTTWDEYKQYVSETDEQAAADIREAEQLSGIISTMIKQRGELGMSQREPAAKCGIPQSSVAREGDCERVYLDP